MVSMKNNYQYIEEFKIDNKTYRYFSLPALKKHGYEISKMPFSLRIIMESMIRNVDEKSITTEEIENLLKWPNIDKSGEISFKVSRVVMQDFTGVPAVVDLAAMKDAVTAMKKNPKIIEPLVPVDLVIDHSIQVDRFGSVDALKFNEDKEFERNKERYKFLKWAQSSFKTLKIIPPSNGIIHQINLEYLAKVAIVNNEGYVYPDTLVGTDSHTTMISGLGIVGWGVGGIEAEAAMLGQPVTFTVPEVIGVNLHGKLQPGITATDLVLNLTAMLRKHNVVGKFLEFFGVGIKELSVPDRATISNMCPEYGATLALFPIDDRTLDYLYLSGRSKEQIDIVRKYYQLQKLFGAQEGILYDQVIDVDLSKINTVISGPALPQQKVEINRTKDSFLSFINVSDASKIKGTGVLMGNKENVSISDGDVVIAAITSCTNTSNPSVMIAAGLVAKKAVERGLKVSKKVKTSLAPGSRVVSEYLEKSGLQKYLDMLGFNIVGYGCTTCIGNSGPLIPEIEDAIVKNKLSAVAVLSGNRNFEARIHKNVRANYLMSPPLVVTFALAGTILKDITVDPVGIDQNGKPVFLKEIWPTEKEINEVLSKYITREMFLEEYANIYKHNEKWNELSSKSGEIYQWETDSTYIRKPPFFDGFRPGEEKYENEIKNCRPLLVLGDSVTTDHISPAGSISKDSPAGKYLIEHGVSVQDFNSYGSRRGNHEVMMRGTFSNTRLKNKLASKEGGFTKKLPEGKEMYVYDAAMAYMSEKVPVIIFAGIEYGTGSSRDWAAKGTYLLGVKAVIAKSFERIHRSNLVGMGVLPLQFNAGEDLASLNIDVEQLFTLKLPEDLKPGANATLFYTDTKGANRSATLKIRLDSEAEIEYYKAGGILQYVLNKLI
ncbi:MAG: aconitate hydratase AcnA [Thermoplasmata archaeon]